MDVLPPFLRIEYVQQSREKEVLKIVFEVEQTVPRPLPVQRTGNRLKTFWRKPFGSGAGQSGSGVVPNLVMLSMVFIQVYLVLPRAVIQGMVSFGFFSGWCLY